MKNIKHTKILESLSPLLVSIQNDLSKYDQDTIAQKLFDLGMEQEFAQILVSSMIKQAPTLEYEFKIISEISDDVFGTLIPNLMKDVWVKKLKFEKIAEKYKISRNTVDCFVNATREIMTLLCRKETDIEGICGLCKNNNMNDNKIEILTNTFKIYQEFWFDMLVFSNTQDNFMNDQVIIQQNNAILETLKEILKILKGSDSSHNSHFQ